MTSSTAHDAVILDQFSRQAAPFAALPAHSNEAALDLCLALAKVVPEDTVLDVACGPGILACAMARTARRVTGIDITPAMIEQAQGRQRALGLDTVSWQIGDGRRLPFADGAFTLVTSRYAFHHIADPQAALTEMKRVCTRDGRIMMIDATPEADKRSAYDEMETLRDPSHVRALTLAELRTLARELGLVERECGFYWLEMDLDQVLGASATPQENLGRLRDLIGTDADSGADRLGMRARRDGPALRFAYPVSILVVSAPPRQD
jgi:SAM-dependent methyltransferase